MATNRIIQMEVRTAQTFPFGNPVIWNYICAWIPVGDGRVTSIDPQSASGTVALTSTDDAGDLYNAVVADVAAQNPGDTWEQQT